MVLRGGNYCFLSDKAVLKKVAVLVIATILYVFSSSFPKFSIDGERFAT